MTVLIECDRQYGRHFYMVSESVNKDRVKKTYTISFLLANPNFKTQCGQEGN